MESMKTFAWREVFMLRAFKGKFLMKKNWGNFIFSLAIFILMNSCASNKFEFIDAGGGQHKTRLYENVARHDFREDGFVARGSRMTYTGKGYTSRQGIDISHHDGKIDWKKVKAWGADFVILRVGYMGYQSGKIKIDERFHQNIKDALAAGLEVGVYIFAQAINEEEALEEARFVLQEIKDYKITLPVVYDPESIPWDVARTDGVSKKQFTKNARVFCGAVRDAGYKPMIYMNMMWQAFQLDLEELSEFDFWYADYEKIPQTPYRFTFWQYSCMGIVDGINVSAKKDCLVDMNIWILKDE